MKTVIYIITVLFIIAVGYILMSPPKEVTLQEIHSSGAPHTGTKEPATQETTPIDSPETDGEDKVQIDYYIIIESFRNLTLAQQKAEKLKNDSNTNIIVLPPTTEGYYRISYGKYSTLEEAKSAIKSIRTNISSHAWINSVKK